MYVYRTKTGDRTFDVRYETVKICRFNELFFIFDSQLKIK